MASNGDPVSGATFASCAGGVRSRHDAPGRRYVGYYLLLGAVSSAMASLSALVYLVTTPGRPNRELLYAGVSVGVVFGALFAFMVRRFIGSRWETAWFFGWSIACMALIYGAAQIDGGAESPISWLLILPVVYASINYPVAATALIAAAASLGALGLMITAGDWGGGDWFRLLFVITFDVMALSSAMNRRAYALAEERLTIVSMHDGLTGCLNNAAFHQRLRAEAARAQRSGRPFSVVMCDADGFKTINDTYGHEVGDEILRLMGRVLLNSARASDDVGRVGGDEFGILLTDTTQEQAEAMARRLHDAVRDTRFPVPATLSAGAATWLGSADTVLAAMQRADAAMYEAKRTGGDRLVISRPNLNPRLQSGGRRSA